MKNDNTKIIIATAAGAAAGLVAGLLMAPSAGKDSRENLVGSLSALAEGFNSQIAAYSEKINGLASTLKKATGGDAASSTEGSEQA